MVGRVAALAGRLVLEQLGDLAEREAGVVAKPLDEFEPLDVGFVVEAVVAFGPGRGLEQAQLFVIANGSGRQPDLRGRLLDAEQTGLGADGVPFSTVIAACYRNLAVYVKVRVCWTASQTRAGRRLTESSQRPTLSTVAASRAASESRADGTNLQPSDIRMLGWVTTWGRLRRLSSGCGRDSLWTPEHSVEEEAASLAARPVQAGAPE